MAKLKNLGKEAEKWIMELSAQNYSGTQIADKLREKYNIVIHPSNVNRFIKQRFMFAASMARGREIVVQESEELLAIFKTDLMLLREKIWDMINDPDVSQNPKELRATIALLDKHLEKMKMLLTSVRTKEFEQISILDASSNISDTLKKLEKEGYIIIKKSLPGM